MGGIDHVSSITYENGSPLANEDQLVVKPDGTVILNIHAMSAPLSGTTVTTLCTLPTEARPRANKALMAWARTSQTSLNVVPLRCYLQASTGRIIASSGSAATYFEVAITGTWSI